MNSVANGDKSGCVTSGTQFFFVNNASKPSSAVHATVTLIKTHLLYTEPGSKREHAGLVM